MRSLIRTLLALTPLSVATAIQGTPDPGGCTQCIASFSADTAWAYYGYNVSVTLNGSLGDMKGQCIQRGTTCNPKEPCRIQLTVSWTVPAPSPENPDPCRYGEWCRTQISPYPDPIPRCTSTGQYCSSGSNSHEEAVACGFMYVDMAKLWNSFQSFTVSCSECQ